jgi:hypothetical protein
VPVIFTLAKHAFDFGHVDAWIFLEQLQAAFCNIHATELRALGKKFLAENLHEFLANRNCLFELFLKACFNVSLFNVAMQPVEFETTKLFYRVLVGFRKLHEQLVKLFLYVG